MDPFARAPDIAIYVMDGGYVVKDCAVELDGESDCDKAMVSVSVNERVTTSKQMLLALVGRLMDAAVARKRSLDDFGNEEGDLE